MVQTKRRLRAAVTVHTERYVKRRVKIIVKIISSDIKTGSKRRSPYSPESELILQIRAAIYTLLIDFAFML